jgi:hypothetical protein
MVVFVPSVHDPAVANPSPCVVMTAFATEPPPVLTSNRMVTPLTGRESASTSLTEGPGIADPTPPWLLTGEIGSMVRRSGSFAGATDAPLHALSCTISKAPTILGVNGRYVMRR